MTVVNKYRLWCTTDNKYVTEWAPTEPTDCPENAAHGVDAAKTAIMEVSGGDAPQTSDGKPIVLPQLLRGDILACFAGKCDDIVNGTRWGGNSFCIESTVAEDKTVEIQFLEWVYLVGGEGFYKGAVIGDYADMTMTAPATAGTNNPGAGAYNKVDVGGFNIFVPAPGVDGDWDLDLEETLNANVGFSKVVPVPSADGTGWFDWSEDETVTFNATQTGGFNLFDAAIPLTHFVIENPLMGDNKLSLLVPATKPKRVLPHWTMTVKLHNSTAKDLDLCWYFYLGRAAT